MLRADIWASLPGLQGAVETYEAAWSWGPAYGLVWKAEEISSAAVDTGNTPTTTLRPGLLLGKIAATGLWTNYSPTATDGSEVAAAVLPTGVRMTDILTGVAQARFYALIVGGRIQARNILGLDGMARAQMFSRFQFDDDVVGAAWFPWKRFQTKTTAYSVLSTDNFSIFDNTGATGSVTFTLPAIAAGLCYGFRVVADQNVIVASNEGANMIALNNASANSVAFQTGGGRIGGSVRVYTNPAATKWIVENESAGTNTITVA